RRTCATNRAPAISRPTVAAVTAVAARAAKSVAASAANATGAQIVSTIAAGRDFSRHAAAVAAIAAVAANAPVTANCTAVRAIGRGTISAVSAVRTIHTERVRSRCTSSAHRNGDRQQNKSCYQQAQRNKLWNVVKAVFIHM